MGKTNAKKEFLEHISEIVLISGVDVLCAQILTEKKAFYLTTGWTKEDWDNFLSDLDFQYDSGYGGQNLFGTIWYTDGTWSERGEYDGSEWWDYNQCPNIPSELNRIDKVREKKLNEIL